MLTFNEVTTLVESFKIRIQEAKEDIKWSNERLKQLRTVCPHTHQVKEKISDYGKWSRCLACDEIFYEE
jgi:ribosome-binding protein aMBF1 (putative translation factor)